MTAVVVLAMCDGDSREPVSLSSTASAQEPRLFDPDAVRAPEGSSVAQVRALLDADRATEARRVAETALPASRPEVAGRLRWLAARAAGDDSGAALPHLLLLSESTHPLSRWAQLRRAALLEEDEPADAVAAALPLTIDAWAGQRQARTIHARALAATGDVAAAMPFLRALVAETADNVGAASAGMPLAAILEGSDDVALREEALGLYRRVYTRAPGARVGREAGEKAEALLATLPQERRDALRQIPAEDLYVRAEALYNSMRHERAEQAFAIVAAQLRDDPERRCEARLMQGKAMIRRRQRREGAAHMTAVAEQCASVDVKAWARYRAGRAHAALGERQEALTQYAALEREAPAHRLADDALYRAALVELGAGNDEGFVTRMEALPTRYPAGDMQGEALFRLAWHARSKGDHGAALVYLERAIRQGPGEHDEDISGRAAYWRGRTLVELGRVEEGLDAYEAHARAWPLSYYAQQSIARLDEAAPARSAALREAMNTPEGGDETLRFPWRDEMGQPAFVRALELLRVGAIDEATRELDTLGARGEGSDPSMLWLTAALLDRAGSLPAASRLVRRRLASFRRTAPVGRSRQLWRLAYPKAYAPLIEEAAGRESLPAAFVRAIAREESTFDARAVSWAHAYGLVQIILPTARRFANGAEVNARTLRDPETNLRVGSHFMKFLFDRYEANPAVVPSAYNAGHNACDRWLRQRRDLPLDEWVEEIPYDETRRYTRRVLQTYGTYSWLDTGTLPPMRTALPRR